MVKELIVGECEMADFGRYLKALREKRGLGVNQLATMSGVSPALISKVENGKRGAPKTSTLDELAKILKVSQIEIYFMAGHQTFLQIYPDTPFSEEAYKNMTESDLEVVKNYKKKQYKHRDDIRKELKEKPSNIIGEKIKKLRKKKNIEINELAEDLGLADFVIYNIESGEYIPDSHMVTVFAEYFDVSADYLLGRNENQDENKVWEKFKEANNIEFSTDEEYIKVPILGEVKAGYNLFAEENIIGYNYVPKSEMNGGDFFYLKVKGDSMINIGIQEGFLVKVKKQNYIDENGKIGLVLIDDMEGTIKRIYRNGDKVILQAENDDIPPEAYDPDQIKILGQVVKAEINL